MRKNHKANVSMNCTVVVYFISILYFSTFECVCRSFQFMSHTEQKWPPFGKEIYGKYNMNTHSIHLLNMEHLQGLFIGFSLKEDTEERKEKHKEKKSEIALNCCVLFSLHLQVISL